tara:strand:- start:3798 stop:4097 length:300 start_codon:yes stop_codon:yes gene_type:complete
VPYRDKLKVGDLVFISAFGRSVLKPNPAKVGIIIAGPYDRMYQCLKTKNFIKYLTYDIMFGNELLTDVPDDFVKRMEDDEHEENPRGLEKTYKRDEPEG